MTHLSYRERALKATHPKIKALFELMEKKKSNLALAADVTQKKELLKLADEAGPHLCILKTHIDVIEDFDLDLVQKLKELSKKHQFLIFEDRKFADIGNTVYLQYQKGIYQISSWADIINAHPVVGPGVIQGLKKGSKDQALLLLAQMSSKENLMDAAYTDKVTKLAEEHSDFVGGFISMKQVTKDPAFIHMTPGIQLQENKDALGQQYRTPEQALTQDFTDIIIVGRGIYEAPEPAEKAQEYQTVGWDCYLKRLSSE